MLFKRIKKTEGSGDWGQVHVDSHGNLEILENKKKICDSMTNTKG